MQIIRRKALLSQPLDKRLSPVLDRVLRHRGVQSLDDIQLQTKSLLHYKDMLNIDRASELVVNAIIQQKNICIVGDFDADGATSTALCMLCLRDFGHRHASYIVPNRFDYGYGLSEPVVDLAAQAGAELLITVDNGISSHAGVSAAKAQGMQVLVTDHHLPANTLPEADAILNPNQGGCKFESKNLAGVGVAFYLMLAVRARLLALDYFTDHKIALPNIADYLDIVALGTVADVVPLDKNNRILVHQGLQRIRSGNTRKGIQAILNIARRPAPKLASIDLGFVLGPRLNAAGRLDDISTGIECLLTEDEEKARDLASSLNSLNTSRQSIEKDMQALAERALAQLKLDQSTLPAGLCIYDENFHVGVVGIVAGRLKEKYYKPTIVFAKESEQVIKGSARSIPGVHIRDLLESISSHYPELIIKFGGHAMAAGLSIKIEHFARFASMFAHFAEKLCQDLPNKAQIYSDGALSVQELNLDIANELKCAIPWGQSFEAPTFDDEFSLIQQRIVGDKHLKLLLSKDGQMYDAIAFNVDTEAWPNNQAQRIRAAYQLDANEYQQRVNLQLIISALEALD